MQNLVHENVVAIKEAKQYETILPRSLEDS